MTIAGALLVIGGVVTLYLLAYIPACRWAPWTLMPRRVRRRVALLRLLAPWLAAGGAVLIAAGLLLAL